MPRNGSGVYSKPAGTTAVPNTTVESAKYNATIDDLVQDANDPRPITAGGTGSGTVAGARTNLGVDQAKTFVTKSGAYTAVAADKNTHIRFDGAYTLSLTAAATLSAGWFCEVQADGGAVTIDPNASETINGSTTVIVPDGYSIVLWCDGTNFITTDDAWKGAAKVDIVDAKWFSKAIGELYAVDDSMTGADVPPTDDSRFRYIKLTAGLTGSGQYNNGVLTSESVSGSAPLVIATAVISLSGSPLDGRTVNLLNTERRFLRAGSAGTVEQDTVQEHDHANSLISPGGSAAGASGASYTLRSAGAVSGARTSNETRAKNLGVTYFMRIK